MRSASPLLAVRKITGVAASAGICRIWRHSSRPSLPGTMMSRMKSAGPLPFGLRNDGVSGGEHFHRESVRFQMVPHQAGNVRIVFDHKDAGFHGGYCSGRACGRPSRAILRLVTKLLAHQPRRTRSKHEGFSRKSFLHAPSCLCGQRFRREPVSMIKFPGDPAGNSSPEEPTVVALYSVTTAGPEYFLPTSRASRERIAAASFFPEKNTGAQFRNNLAGLCPAWTGEGARPHMSWGAPRAMRAWGDLIVARKRSVTSSTSRWDSRSRSGADARCENPGSSCAV